MTEEEKAIEEAAFSYARECRAALARQIADPSLYPAEYWPWTIFMAGSPGAGKTEVSKAMKEALETAHIIEGEDEGEPDLAPAKVLRIDPDEFRELFPGYTGANSYLFQGAVTKILEKVLDRAFEKKMSFLLDGTMSNLEVAKKNIERALKKERCVQILYVYQKPELAWKFVLAREITEGRKIPLEDFVRQYFDVRQNVKEILRVYSAKGLYVDLMIKNTDGTDEKYEFSVTSEQIDELIPETYDHDQLLAILRESEQP
jgi:adenylate kinase family enzyme